MKKAITVFDGEHFSEAAINFIKEYPSDKKPLLVGVFLSGEDYSNQFGYSLSMGGTITAVIEDTRKISENILRFKKLCEENHITYKVHNDSGETALEKLKYETVFADLLIISSEQFYRHGQEEQPNAYMKNILQNTACPVLLLPEKFTFPQNIIVAYDNSEASVFALKHFSYVFPELRGHKATIVYATDGEEDIPQAELLKELAERHFPQVALHKLEFPAQKYFSTWAANRENSILVAGGYSQKGLFSVFHKNFLEDVIGDHSLPVFIAHK